MRGVWFVGVVVPGVSISIGAQSENPPMPGFDAEGSDPEAIAAADEVMESLGGRRAWDESRYLTWKFYDRKATFHAEDGVTITRDGKPIQPKQIVELEMGEKHAIAINDLKMWLHYSGERLAIRLRDLNASYRKEFAGLDWFPVDPKFRVEAKFTPHTEEKKVEMLNILGDIEVFEAAGYVDFELQAQKVHMEPMKAREGALWLIFRDGTSGKGSYQAVRFLRTEPPENGKVVIDFNRAYNPPCAYNPHTTCPMPTKENRLEIRIEAGEKNYKKHS